MFEKEVEQLNRYIETHPITYEKKDVHRGQDSGYPVHREKRGVPSRQFRSVQNRQSRKRHPDLKEKL